MGRADAVAAPPAAAKVSMGFHWCMKKPVALGSSGARRPAGDDASARGASRDTEAREHEAEEASPNPARDLAASLSAFAAVPYSPGRNESENNAGERRSRALSVPAPSFAVPPSSSFSSQMTARGRSRRETGWPLIVP